MSRVTHTISAVATLALLAAASPVFAADTGNGSGARLANCGVTYVYPRPPAKTVVYANPAVENMLALGLKAHILGVAGTVVTEPGGSPWEADKAGLRYITGPEGVIGQEALLSMEPDLVYSPFYYYLSTAETANRETLSRFNIRSYLSPTECVSQSSSEPTPVTFEMIFGELRDLADNFDVEAAGETLIASLQARLDAAKRSTAGLSSVSTVWYYAGTRTPYIAGCCGLPDLLTKEAGATNAYADVRSLWPEGNWEVIAARDPAVIVLGDLPRGGEGDSAAAKIAFLESNPVTAAMTAVRNKRYVILPGSDLDPSVCSIFALERLTQGLLALGLGR